MAGSCGRDGKGPELPRVAPVRVPVTAGSSPWHRAHVVLR